MKPLIDGMTPRWWSRIRRRRASTTIRSASTTPCAARSASRSLQSHVDVLGAFAALFAVAAGLFAAARRLLNRPKRVGVAVIVDPRTTPRSTPRARVHSVQAADLTLPLDALEASVDAAPPRAPGAHVLALPHARDARDRPREVHGDRPLHRRADQAVHAAELPRARVRDGRRARHRALADQQGPARRAARAARATATSRSRCAAASASTTDRMRLHVRVEVANFYPCARVGDRALVLPGERSHAST